MPDAKSLLPGRAFRSEHAQLRPEPHSIASHGPDPMDPLQTTRMRNGVLYAAEWPCCHDPLRLSLGSEDPYQTKAAARGRRFSLSERSANHARGRCLGAARAPGCPLSPLWAFWIWRRLATFSTHALCAWVRRACDGQHVWLSSGGALCTRLCPYIHSKALLARPSSCSAVPPLCI